MKGQITGKTKLLGIIGSPVEHSLSPAMHNYSAKKLGLDYVYLAFDVKKEETEKALESIRTLGIRGVNATMPCKKAVIPFLDECSPAVEIMEAANTIMNENGRLIGHNTDGLGLVRSIEEAGETVEGKTICLFGVGGAGSAILVALALEGAKAIHLFNRKGAPTEELDHLFRRLKKKAPHCHTTLSAMNDHDQKAEKIGDSQIIINATSVGMHPEEDASPVENPNWLVHKPLVVDTVYNPLHTRLLREAEEMGCRTVDGHGMLLWQGAAAFKLFTDHDMPVDDVKEKIFGGKKG